MRRAFKQILVFANRFYCYSSVRMSNKMTSETALPPRKSSEYIAERAGDVKLNFEGIKKTAKELANILSRKEYSIENWKAHELNPKSGDKAAIDWVFFVDTLNFSFWSSDEDNKYSVVHHGKTYTGYWSLCAAVNKALEVGIPLTDPEYFSKITRADLEKIFDGSTSVKMPMLDERLQCLHEIGTVLLQKFNGSFVNCIAQCDQSSQKLLQLILHNFPCFVDEGVFDGKKVAFWKRAQILVADVWAVCGGQGYGKFTDIDTVTMFADYRIPQALVYLGCMDYSDKLMELLNKDHVFKSGDREEMEIRGCCIWAVELIVEKIKKILELEDVKDIQVNSIIIDEYLWEYRRQFETETKQVPFHKVRSIYY